ncbi:MAG: prepilin-type N-terminal cleavage/methylation domain-containing protein [Pyrinomonadaceae bacterium]
MKKTKTKKSEGFSLIELLIAMTLMLVLLGIVSTLFSRSLGVRARESRRTDALTSAQAALNVMSREIANSGFGLYADSVSKRALNGIVIADSSANKIHFRSNIVNIKTASPLPPDDINKPGEDITYYFDSVTNSILRYDAHAVYNSSTNTYTPQSSVIINRISNVSFDYFNYSGSVSTPTKTTTPTVDTGRVTITVIVNLEPVQGQPDNQKVTFSSDVTLRNSNYMLNQY